MKKTAWDIEIESPVAGYHSRFGGTWLDRDDARERLAQRVAEGAIDEEESLSLRHWMRDGFVVLEGAVPRDACDRILEENRAFWRGDRAGAHVEYWRDGELLIVPIAPELEALQAKLLDTYAFSETVRDALFQPRLVRFLELLFGEPPLAFQSLSFERGTEQPIHQDTAYVQVDRPLEFVGTWLALEDIVEGSGELEYYIGSHRLEDFLWDGRHKGRPPGHPYHEAYLHWLHLRAGMEGLERRRFLPRKGDLLVWHADLAHGGSKVGDPSLTRRSLVTHFCSTSAKPHWFDYVEHSGRLEHPSGATWCIQHRRGSPSD